METVNAIELHDETIYPDEQVLKGILGDSYSVYCELLKLFDENTMEYTWRYYRDGKAWLCKVQKKKRTIIWMSAWKGYMQASIYIPEKYIAEIDKLPISEAQKEKFRQTKHTGTSKACIFEIRSSAILADLEEVMRFKMMSK
jgi:hypothetical protein